VHTRVGGPKYTERRAFEPYGSLRRSTLTEFARKRCCCVQLSNLVKRRNHRREAEAIARADIPPQIRRESEFGRSVQLKLGLEYSRNQNDQITVLNGCVETDSATLRLESADARTTPLSHRSIRKQPPDRLRLQYMVYFIMSIESLHIL
jgi:hypothetical protein